MSFVTSKTSSKGGVLNFEQTYYTHPQNGQQYRMYQMDRDGFTLLVMGYTGDKALYWKLQYIAAFNTMEEVLRERHPPEHMSPSRGWSFKLRQSRKPSTRLRIRANLS